MKIEFNDVNVEKFEMCFVVCKYFIVFLKF